MNHSYVFVLETLFFSADCKRPRSQGPDLLPKSLVYPSILSTETELSSKIDSTYSKA